MHLSDRLKQNIYILKGTTLSTYPFYYILANLCLYTQDDLGEDKQECVCVELDNFANMLHNLEGVWLTWSITTDMKH